MFSERDKMARADGESGQLVRVAELMRTGHTEARPKAASTHSSSSRIGRVQVVPKAIESTVGLGVFLYISATLRAK